MSENAPKYILCPRCELNYIEESEGQCKVCKAAMGLLDPSILIPEDDDDFAGEKLCPICKENYIGEDEDMCYMCKREKEAAKNEESGEESDEEWRSYVDDEVPEEDGLGDISLSELAEEEEEEEEDEEDEESVDDDDFDDYSVDEADFEDEEEEEDEDDEKDE